MDFKLEICTDTVESAVAAQKAGADRIELCSNLIEGGTTPSWGTIATARENLTIQLNVIIRPRGGDFLYTTQEIDIMKKDIVMCRDAGVDGVVTGILKQDGSIDTDSTSMLVDLAYPMQVTFHRAFDMCSDPYKGLEDVINSGAQRLLTSGQKDKAEEGAELIAELITQSSGRLIIMPGSGISDSNIERIATITGASEFHLTGRKLIDSAMLFRKEGVKMGGIPTMSEYSRKVADPDLIERVIHILNIF
jgi:copper homeostasis protein